MGAVGWLIRSRLRTRWAAFAVIGLVAALGTMGTLVAAGAADRTANAYSRYRERANVGDVTINPSLISRDIDHVIRTLPGVEAVSSAALFAGGYPDDRPNPDPESAAADESVQVLGSADGRYVDMDRPAVAEGRLPTGHNEVLVNVEYAHAKHLHVGDVFRIGFQSRRDQLTNEAQAPKLFAIDRVKVVGIATLSDEVLPDGVYFRYRVIVSKDIAARYDCLPDAPGPNATFEEALARFAPANCSTSYIFYSLSIRGGDRGVRTALDAFSKRSAELSARLPKSLQAQGFGYSLVGKTVARDEQDRVERSIAPITTALFVLAAAAAAITVVTLGLVLARDGSRAGEDQLAWWRLGLTTFQRATVISVPLFIVVGLGVALALVGAWLLSPIAPFGTVRSVEHSPALEITRWVWLTTVALSLTFGVLIALLAYRSSRSVGARRVRAPTSVMRNLSRRASRRPEVEEGIRAAYSTNRSAGLVVTLAGSAFAVFLAALVFGTSLSTLTTTPVSYGWPWDVAAVANFGYGGFDSHKVAATLDHRKDVRKWTELGFSSAILLDRDAVPALFGLGKPAAIDLTIVRGRLPIAADEVAVGTRTAAEHHLGLGDKVTVGGYEVAARRAAVTAIVVLPSLGPFQADHATPGRGIYIPEAMLKKGLASRVSTFVGIELAPGVARAAAVRDLRDEIGPWDPTGYPVMRYSKPIRPPEIINARSVRVAPLLVGGLLVFAATIGLAVAIVISVRARRRELAVLRTLGFTSRQLRVSVRVQALATMIGGFVVGAPVGIAVGRIAWRAFASELGVVTAVSTPVAWIVLTGAGGAAIAALAAAGPARLAARTRPAVTLRAE
jgi:hypothetical protein